MRAGTVWPYGPVAIKLPRESGSEQAFRSEAVALAAAGGGHANVVQVYAIAIEPGYRPHVAILMRRWETTLHAVLHIEGGRLLGARHREAVAFQLASGLVALHAANVLHRDVKSGNALLNLAPVERGGVQACWSDFGLARVEAISTVRTQTAMGSLGYMAPEIADPPAGSVIAYRAAADVYAFGVVLAELVSGKAPAWRGGMGMDFLADWVRARRYQAADCADQDVFCSHPLRVVAELMLGVVKETTAQDFGARPVMVTVKAALERDARAGQALHAPRARPDTDSVAASPAVRSAAPLAATAAPRAQAAMPVRAAPPAQAAPPASAVRPNQAAEPRECTICLDKPVATVLRPCNHAVLCSTCARLPGWDHLCTVCRAEATTFDEFDPLDDAVANTFLARTAPPAAPLAQPAARAPAAQPTAGTLEAQPAARRGRAPPDTASEDGDEAQPAARRQRRAPPAAGAPAAQPAAPPNRGGPRTVEIGAVEATYSAIQKGKGMRGPFGVQGSFEQERTLNAKPAEMTKENLLEHSRALGAASVGGGSALRRPGGAAPAPAAAPAGAPAGSPADAPAAAPAMQAQHPQAPALPPALHQPRNLTAQLKRRAGETEEQRAARTRANPLSNDSFKKAATPEEARRRLKK